MHMQDRALLCESAALLGLHPLRGTPPHGLDPDHLARPSSAFPGYPPSSHGDPARRASPGPSRSVIGGGGGGGSGSGSGGGGGGGGEGAVGGWVDGSVLPSPLHLDGRRQSLGGRPAPKPPS
jgi:hypothetical protein